MKTSIGTFARFFTIALSLLLATNLTASGQTEQPRPPRPQLPPGVTPAHDPVMAKEGDTYYMFCTGRGISVFSSKDMENWKPEKPIFETSPAWTAETVLDFKGHFWAPDIIYHNGKYHIFYSVSSFGKNTSAIGRVENVTLNPEDPRFKWEDKGMIVQSVPNRDMWNAIDANIVIDEEGTPWMSFGSFWNGIKQVKLKNDLSAIAYPEEWNSISRRPREFSLADSNPGNGAVEAPFIFKKNGYYYLFVSFDFCCRGAESTYKVVVGRSKDVKGPYLDREGVPMSLNGGTIVVEGDQNWAGVGHNSAYTFDGKDYLVFHGYSLKYNGMAILVIRDIEWDEQGWPTVKL